MTDWTEIVLRVRVACIVILGLALFALVEWAKL